MSLREELAQIPGVVEADVDLRDGEPTAVRIHSVEGSDQRVIAEAVQYALRRHGLRSRVAPPRTSPEPVAAPAPPHLSLTTPRPLPTPVGRPSDGEAGGAAEPRETRRIKGVRVHDDGEIVVVQVDDTIGGVETQRTRRSTAGQIGGVVRATARLCGADVIPAIIDVKRWEHEGDRFVTVVLDLDGVRSVGSAIDDGVELRAVAMAVWQALHA